MIFINNESFKHKTWNILCFLLARWNKIFTLFWTFLMHTVWTKQVINMTVRMLLNTTLYLRWWCTPPKRWSCRWRGKASTWRWVSTSSSSVRPSPGWSGTPSPWPLPPRRTSSLPTSVSLATGLRRCMRPAGETRPSLRRHGNCPSMTIGEGGCQIAGWLYLIVPTRFLDAVFE